MHKSWGSFPILIRTLSLCFYHNIFWSVWSVCFWKFTLFFWYFVPSWKVWWVWFICWNLSLLSGVGYLIPCFMVYPLGWDISLSMCVLLISYAHWFCLVLVLNFGFNLVLLWIFGIIWTFFLIYLVLVQIVSHLVLESLVHAYLLYVYLMACLLSLSNI